jgi:hypothetical protein
MLIPSLGGLAPPVRLSSPAPQRWGAVFGRVEVEGLALGLNLQRGTVEVGGLGASVSFLTPLESQFGDSFFCGGEEFHYGEAVPEGAV